MYTNRPRGVRVELLDREKLVDKIFALGLLRERRDLTHIPFQTAYGKSKSGVPFLVNEDGIGSPGAGNTVSVTMEHIGRYVSVRLPALELKSAATGKTQDLALFIATGRRRNDNFWGIHSFATN